MSACKRAALLLLCGASLLLGGCSALTLEGEASPASPNLRLLSMPAYQDEELSGKETPEAGHLMVDLWLEASQVMGGINPGDKSLYPHNSRKYREGGFHYRYGTEVGMYENVLRDMLAAAEGFRIRVLRCGNERLPDAFLTKYGVAREGASQDELRSLRRDMLTYAIEPMPSLFAELSAEDMTDSFYSLGSPKLNQMARFGDGAELENPGLTNEMSAALDAQRAAIQSGDAGALSAARDDTDYPLLYALQNLDLSRLSVITCDPASLRRLSGTAKDGATEAYVEALLAQRGVFDKGLCAGLYAFTLDYMGQLSSFGPADFSEPLVWGRLKYNSKTHRSESALPMPRIMLALVIGTPEHVAGFTDALNRRLEADTALMGLRGPEKGELTYTENGQTVTQQPFSFAWTYTAIQRPGMGYYTQHTEGAELRLLAGQGEVSPDGALRTVSLPAGTGGGQADRTLTLSFPAAELPKGVGLDLSRLQNLRIEVLSALLLSETLQNNAEAASGAAGGSRQVLAHRDTLYAFDYTEDPFAGSPAQNPFTLKAVELSDDGATLLAAITVDGAKLRPGYYRVRVCADLAGEQVSWPSVPWIDGENSLSVSVLNEQIAAWEGFTALMTEYDRDTQIIPKQFQHAWGPVSEKGYHGAVIPDFPPVSRALWLKELFSQLRSAANVRLSPYIRCVFDVFVTGGVGKE